jgi:hypothetical protein
MIILMKNEPFYEPYGSDPRFQALLWRMNLSQY